MQIIDDILASYEEKTNKLSSMSSLMRKAHQQLSGKNACIYSCKNKSKYSAVKRTLCPEKKKCQDPRHAELTAQTPWT